MLYIKAHPRLPLFTLITLLLLLLHLPNSTTATPAVTWLYPANSSNFTFNYLDTVYVSWVSQVETPSTQLYCLYVANVSYEYYVQRRFFSQHNTTQNTNTAS